MGRDEAREEARDEIAGQMRESFGALAQAAVSKSSTLDANAAWASAPNDSLICTAISSRASSRATEFAWFVLVVAFAW